MRAILLVLIFAASLSAQQLVGGSSGGSGGGGSSTTTDAASGYYPSSGTPAYDAYQLVGGAAGTATRIYCRTKTGTIDLDVSFTADPETAGTAIESTITCTTSGVEDTSLSGTTAIPADNFVHLAWSNEQSGFDEVFWSVEATIP